LRALTLEERNPGWKEPTAAGRIYPGWSKKETAGWRARIRNKWGWLNGQWKTVCLSGCLTTADCLTEWLNGNGLSEGALE